MGSDKIPLMAEREYSYKGVFDLNGTYTYIKQYLEHSRHYDLTESELEEKNEDGKRQLISKLVAEQEFTDYYKIELKIELKFEGVEVLIESSSGHAQKLVKGKAQILVNAYLHKDFMNKREKTPLSAFLDKVYHKFVGNDEISNAIGTTAQEVGALVGRFKQSVNSAVK